MIVSADYLLLTNSEKVYTVDMSNSRSLSVDDLYVGVYVVKSTRVTAWITDKSQHAAAALGSYCHSNVAVQPVASSNARRRPCLHNTTYVIIDSAPSLGVYYFLSLTLSVCPSVCLSVMLLLQIDCYFLFLDRINPFF